MFLDKYGTERFFVGPNVNTFLVPLITLIVIYFLYVKISVPTEKVRFPLTSTTIVPRPNYITIFTHHTNYEVSR